MVWLLSLIAVFCIVIGSVASGSRNSRGQSSRWQCPHGYDDYGCSAGCPLYNHCIGDAESSSIRGGWYDDDRCDFNSSSTMGFEDDDWRTVYMDDERYDDREADEWFDDDREDNAW